MKTVQRFFESIRVDTETKCWVWIKSTGSGGCGKFYDGKAYTASRWAYEFFVRPISTGYLVCHRCDNPPCVNPRHLFQGTHQENFMDAVTKKRVLPRLKEKQVREIRERLSQGENGAAIAREYKMRKHAIYEIKHRVTYKWVE